MAQIIPIVSEALQSTIRRLLPSQNGFGEDLQAQNVIVPIIDLTPSAEGSTLDVSLQQALAFGSQTAFEARAGTANLMNTTGFWRIVGGFTEYTTSGADVTANIKLSDGLSTKIVWNTELQARADDFIAHGAVDFIVFLAAGESCSVEASSTGTFAGSYRQVATSTGELINPSGFIAE
jgi:hypothetical protein